MAKAYLGNTSINATLLGSNGGTNFQFQSIVSVNYLLQENGSFLLQEDNNKIEL